MGLVHVRGRACGCVVQVDEYNVIRLRLTAEMADSSNLVKSLVIKAEDARILFDMCVHCTA